MIDIEDRERYAPDMETQLQAFQEAFRKHHRAHHR